jgi:hypothetical protein
MARVLTEVEAVSSGREGGLASKVVIGVVGSMMKVLWKERNEMRCEVDMRLYIT